MSPTRPPRGTRVPARTRTTLPGVEVRRQLFEAALIQIRSQGYEAASIAELTREIGVAKGTFFNHFATKEALLSAWFLTLWEKVEAQIRRRGMGGVDAIHAFCAILSDELDQDPALARALSARLHQLPGLGSGDDASTHPIFRMRSWVELRLQECLPVVVPIREIPLFDLATLVTSAFFDEVVARHLNPPPPSPPVRGAARAGSPLERRLRFLLESAGLPAPERSL
jgi:AcrR family transcriptional regulator